MTKEEYKVICKLIDKNITHLKIVNSKSISYRITNDNIKALKEDIESLVDNKYNTTMAKGEVYKR